MALLVFGDGEEGRPFGQIVEIEVNIEILGERIKVGQVHAQKVLRFELSKRSHCDRVERKWEE